MSKLQEFVDRNEMDYEFAILDIKNAISTYGIDILAEVLPSHLITHLTNVVIPDTMLVQQLIGYQMSNIQNQKSGLAKLLATENLTIQHQKISTAAFDPKNRVLYCPIWENMSGDLYDLLMGHEVGHALDTPSDGWHDTVHAMGKNYKVFLNVVEDARIEKRQKRRYPGLRSSFIKGYDELMKRNFFGIQDRDVNTMTFIDRLNIFSKSGYTMDIQFTDDELVMIEKVKECETWDDVLRVTNEIWDYSKEEQQQNQLPEEYDYRAGESGDGDDTETGSGDGDTETDGEGEEEGKSKAKLDEDGEDAEGSGQGDDDYDGDDEEEDDELSDIINRRKESQGTDEDFEPTCETDDNFRANEASLVAAKAREYVYVNIPTPNLSRIVTPAKRVQELLTEAFVAQCGTVAYTSGSNELYTEFRKKNERYISLLAKEFEMRKAASKFAKAKVSETGDIDVNKIYKYQLDDNIFKKIMRVPKGKSHGMILLLDKSGSMANNLAASYEQILILAMFCRKVNIPFTAYGFGNARNLREMDYPQETNDKFDANGNYKYGFSSGCFTENVRDMQCSEVYLREMINSKMSNAEFSKSVKNILCLMDAWAHRYGAVGKFLRPQCDSLSNTPMSEALIAMQPIIKEFRRVNNLDIVNTTIVHDGDADSLIWFHNTDGDKKTYFSTTQQNVFLVDKKNKVQVNLKATEDDVREGICEWLQKTTGTKIVGFYLTPMPNAKAALKRRLFTDELNKIRSDYYQANELFVKYVKQLKKEKYLESKNTGYDSFYILPAGSDLSVDDESFEVSGKVTTSTLTKAFMKFNKSRQINRVLVSRFITQIAV